MVCLQRSSGSNAQVESRATEDGELPGYLDDRHLQPIFRLSEGGIITPTPDHLKACSWQMSRRGILTLQA